MGVPVLGLLGILEAGRAIPAPLSIAGDWTVAFGSAPQCANPPGSVLQQQAFNISQSGTEARITLNDGRATTLEATVNGTALNAKSQAGTIAATISGKQGARTLEGHVTIPGCAPVAFRAIRQAAQKKAA